MHKILLAKAINTTALVFIGCVAMVFNEGCTREEMPGIDDEVSGITINLRVADPLPGEAGDTQTALLRSVSGAENTVRVVTRSASLGPLPEESLITNAYVLFYIIGANDEATPTAFQSVTAPSAGSDIVIDESQLARLTLGSEYDIYVLASIPSSTTTPSLQMTKGQLLALNEHQFERPAGNPGVSFFGKSSLKYDKGNWKTLSIEVSRLLARLDITLTGLKDGQTAAFRIIDQAITVPYNPGNTTTTPPVHYYTSEPVLKDGIYRTYIYPNYPKKDALYGKARLFLSVLDADGKVVNVYDPIVINGGTIERNKIYEINCSLLP
ncbi:hypothetical protein NXY11_04330 [Parabacteroides faecis]|uniref:hypothetical protein n=1 Tax=Parabacteroides faecis TaxID=1217282 RepID=UPI0021642BBA|nr:hypothetical protein [Parabacteroides faecis]MCS2893937.1 hypothetical protein [Parabacteroides faecis]UVQ47480.1 hypothetical protein NXY11_04330 [Parabacteroides faecis]